MKDARRSPHGTHPSHFSSPNDPSSFAQNSFPATLAHPSEELFRRCSSRSLIPMGRWGVPDDVTGAAVFLCSNESSFITGQSFCINGGMTVWT